jgi:hypothetical protein
MKLIHFILTGYLTLVVSLLAPAQPLENTSSTAKTIAITGVRFFYRLLKKWIK